MKLVTHDDRFHADDVFATAVVKMYFGDNLTDIVRSRDSKEIESADIVLDVGGIYDPAIKRFDHHQPEGAGVRANGINYASFGLVWKEWGTELCGGSEDAAEIVDNVLVSAVDAGDNGISLSERIEGMPHDYVINSLIGSFGATWKENNEIYRKHFDYLVDFAQKVLEREIEHAKAEVESGPLIEAAYQKTEDRRLMVLEDYWPWKSFIEKYPEVLFVISPSKQGDKWRVNAVQEKLFQNKKSLPKEWAGLRDVDLQKVSGVDDAIFCHRALFMAAANSKEGAVALAKKAIEQ